jgi:hypothetical protein
VIEQRDWIWGSSMLPAAKSDRRPEDFVQTSSSGDNTQAATGLAVVFVNNLFTVRLANKKITM